MLIRLFIALAVLIPYFFASIAHPVWLTFLVAFGAFGLGHVINHLTARRGADGEKPRHAKLYKLLATGAVVLGGAGLLFYSSMASAEFYKHVNEVMAAPAGWEGKTFKLHGKVSPGSIHEDIVDQVMHRSFVLEYEGYKVRVVHQGPKPDTFKDLADVVADGTLQRDGDELVFHATDLTAKCPSKYEENQRSKPRQPTAAN